MKVCRLKTAFWIVPFDKYSGLRKCINKLDPYYIKSFNNVRVVAILYNIVYPNTFDKKSGCLDGQPLKVSYLINDYSITR